jgi:hypothetical protein
MIQWAPFTCWGLSWVVETVVRKPNRTYSCPSRACPQWPQDLPSGPTFKGSFASQ